MLSEKSSRKLHILSFILFIGVMTIHTYNLEVYGIADNKDLILVVLETFLHRFANGVCVSFFFLISGFLFFRNFDFSLLLKKYKSRGKSVLMPYVLWNTIYYLYYVCCTRIPLIAGIMSGEEKMPFGLNAYLQYVWSGYYTLWFLRELLWFILLAPLWYIMLKRRKRYRPEGALILLVLISLDVVHIPGIKRNIYYILGAYWGMNYKWITNVWKKSRMSALFHAKQRMPAVGAAVCSSVFILFFGGYAGRVWYNCLLFLMIWGALDLFRFEKEVPWWTKCTFFYYCAHDMLLEAIEKIILIVGGKSTFMAWVDYIGAPAITLTILVAAAWLLKKWMPATWSALSGGRGQS